MASSFNFGSLPGRMAMTLCEGVSRRMTSTVKDNVLRIGRLTLSLLEFLLSAIFSNSDSRCFESRIIAANCLEITITGIPASPALSYDSRARRSSSNFSSFAMIKSARAPAARAAATLKRICPACKNCPCGLSPSGVPAKTTATRSFTFETA
jgi:hypothetical protein